MPDRMRTLASASVAGIAAGLLCGVLARVAMRLIVLVRGEAAEFSLTGTGGIVMTFIAMAAALAVLYAVLTSGYRRGPGALWWTLAGLALLAVALFLTPLRQELARGPAFVVLFIPIGLLLGWIPASLGRVLRSRLATPTSPLASAGYVALSVPGLISVIAMPLLIIFGILQLVGVIPVPAS